MAKAKLKEKPAGRVESLTFEQALAELEQIIGKLEAGELALDEALTLFERGQQLTAWCGTQLDNAELKIQQVTPKAEGQAQLDVDDTGLDG